MPSFGITARDLAEKSRNSFDAADQQMWGERALETASAHAPKQGVRAEHAESVLNPDEAGFSVDDFS